MPEKQHLFSSFFQAGFECSTHRYGSRRLDLLAITKHDQFALRDLLRVREFGIRTVRTGARWHLIERQPGQFEFQSLDVILDAAERAGVEVLLDLLHFGWPDFLDVFDTRFADVFGRYVTAVVRHLKHSGRRVAAFAPVNEISFLAWAGGDVGNIFPHRRHEGRALKASLVRAAIVASERLLQELPDTRLISPEPVIHIVGDPDIAGDEEEAEGYRLAQYEAWDMLSGRTAPELGGRPEYLDILGLNFYDRNQWVHNCDPMERNHPRYRPFREMIAEVWHRYNRPLFVSETGAEGNKRADWLNYVCEEVFAARREGIPVEGICLYPVLNHPGWIDDRYCPNGLFDYADQYGYREVCQPLAQAILRQQEMLRNSNAEINRLRQIRPDLFVSSPVEFRAAAAAAPDE